MLDSDKTFFLYLHIPFDIGFKMGNLPERLEKIKESLGNISGNNISIVRKTEIVKPKPLQEIFKAESNISETVVNVNLYDLIAEKTIENSEFKSFTRDSYINIYDTGIGIGHFKYEVILKNNISPQRIFNAFLSIYRQLETLERELSVNEIESNSSAAVIRDTIIRLRSMSSGTTANRDLTEQNIKDRTFDRPNDSLVLYIYPLFYLPFVDDLQMARDYICLSFLRPNNQEVNRQELNTAILFNTQSFNSEFLLVKWDAAITGGSSVDERASESFENILEICSYIWNSMFIIEAYVGTKLKELTNEQSHLGAEKARKNLDQIQILRVEATNIQGIYSTILVSVWASATQVFERILINSWNLNKIQKSLVEKIDLLAFMYEYTVHESETNVTDRMNTSVYLFQRIAIPIAAVIAILPFLTEPIISNRLVGNILDPKWLLLIDALMLTVLAIIVSYFVDEKRVQRFKEKMTSTRDASHGKRGL